MSRASWLLLLSGLIGMLWWLQPPTETVPRAAVTPALTEPRSATADAAFLPPEALATLRRIRAGGPHPYTQDSSVFFNREGRLPSKPRGYYREYTVDTPGLGHRGARRIVTGGEPPEVWYYTDDHYGSFRPFEPLP
jgi:guanyl-specific ribonuclease Sa